MEMQRLAEILALTTRLLEHAHEADSSLKPTDFYNEGWLTALTLTVAASGVDLYPFQVFPQARWWSEALLRSPFKSRRRGDPRGEGSTSADAVIGHFDRRDKTKRGILLRPSATQFVVVEAKLGSRLSARTTNADDFDQSARTVSCMAWELAEAKLDSSIFTTLGFYVVSPKDYLSEHRKLVDLASIKQKVKARIEAYEEPEQGSLRQWFQGPFSAFLERAILDCVTWDSVINDAVRLAPDRGRTLEAFYKECLILN